jgi:hypothetical protein
MATKKELIDLLKEVIRGDWYHDRDEMPDDENPRVISADLVNRIKTALGVKE